VDTSGITSTPGQFVRHGCISGFNAVHSLWSLVATSRVVCQLKSVSPRHFFSDSTSTYNLFWEGSEILVQQSPELIELMLCQQVLLDDVKIVTASPPSHFTKILADAKPREYQKVQVGCFNYRGKSRPVVTPDGTAKQILKAHTTVVQQEYPLRAAWISFGEPPIQAHSNNKESKQREIARCPQARVLEQFGSCEKHHPDKTEPRSSSRRNPPDLCPISCSVCPSSLLEFLRSDVERNSHH